MKFLPTWTNCVQFNLSTSHDRSTGSLELLNLSDDYILNISHHLLRFQPASSLLKSPKISVENHDWAANSATCKCTSVKWKQKKFQLIFYVNYIMRLQIVVKYRKYINTFCVSSLASPTHESLLKQMSFGRFQLSPRCLLIITWLTKSSESASCSV